MLSQIMGKCSGKGCKKRGFPVGSEGLIYRCTLKLEVCVQARWFIMLVLIPGFLSDIIIKYELNIEGIFGI